jgi:hypothetical protein
VLVFPSWVGTGIVLDRGEADDHSILNPHTKLWLSSGRTSIPGSTLADNNQIAEFLSKFTKVLLVFGFLRLACRSCGLAILLKTSVAISELDVRYYDESVERRSCNQ